MAGRTGKLNGGNAGRSGQANDYDWPTRDAYMRATPVVVADPAVTTRRQAGLASPSARDDLPRGEHPRDAEARRVMEHQNRMKAMARGNRGLRK